AELMHRLAAGDISPLQMLEGVDKEAWGNTLPIRSPGEHWLCGSSATILNHRTFRGREVPVPKPSFGARHRDNTAVDQVFAPRAALAALSPAMRPNTAPFIRPVPPG